MNDALVVALSAALPVSVVVGIWIGRRRWMPPTDEQIARYMNRVVNTEEVEENKRLNAYRMARNGRKTTRFDGGPNARIMRLRVRPTYRRFKNRHK